MQTSKLIILFSTYFTTFIGYSQKAQDSLLQNNINDVINELKLMYELDQSMRNYMEYGLFNSNADSLNTLGTFSDLAKKSVWSNIIKPIDSIKTERMINLINSYGFPSVNRLKKFSNKDLDFNPVIILVHTPFDMTKKLIPIAEKEFKKGNFRSKCEYGYLLWHLHGRSDFKYMLENGYEMETDEKGQFVLKSTCE